MGVPCASLGHFLADFTCALLLQSRLQGTPRWGLCLLVYNFCAFALQMPLGVVADRLNRSPPLAALGNGLIALAWLLSPFPLLCALAAGTGNSCFHVGAGVEVIRRREQRSAPLGIFVSPGALGVFLGTSLAGQLRISPLLPVSVLLAAGILFLVPHRSGQAPPLSPRPEPDLSRSRVLTLAALFLVVVVRSHTGLVLAFPWKRGPWPLLLTCALVLGKCCGGFLADALGLRPAGVLSLGLSGLLFLLSAAPLAGTLAVLFFNMSMPITLEAALRLLPGSRGFAFGLLSFALFLGFLPVCLGVPPLLDSGAGCALGAAVSLLLLLPLPGKGGLP